MLILWQNDLLMTSLWYFSANYKHFLHPYSSGRKFEKQKNSFYFSLLYDLLERNKKQNRIASWPIWHAEEAITS